MAHVIQTQSLVAEGVLTPEQGAIIASRSRQVMVSLVISAVLCLGIIAAAGGFIFLLADALAVAVLGGLFLGGGALVLLKTSDVYRMFGTASALIGAGMLSGGATIEIMDKLGAQTGGLILAAVGLLGAAVAGVALHRGPDNTAFLSGSVLLLTVAMHLGGLLAWANAIELNGPPISLLHLYTATALLAAGLLIDVRLITALAIVPFAQMLDTGTFYWHATYAFYSPEPTLSILQMGLAMAVCIILAGKLTDRIRRHTHLFGIMAFIVANMCFLVGSLWGDAVGSHLFGPGWAEYTGDYTVYQDAVAAFEARTLVISANVYSLVWAVLLVIAAAWAAHTNRRGVFNAAMTFGAIHAYTQFFETFYDEPLAYVIGGLAAIPVAWGLWRLNDRFESLRMQSA